MIKRKLANSARSNNIWSENTNPTYNGSAAHSQHSKTKATAKAISNFPFVKHVCVCTSYTTLD